MAVTYFQILKQVALRIGDGGSIAGQTQAEKETSLAENVFNANNIYSVAFPPSAQRDALRFAEQKLVLLIANFRDSVNQANHPYRSFISSFSSDLPNRSILPKVDANNKPVIGLIGQVKDSATNTVCTKKTIEEIERTLRLQNSQAINSKFYYAIVGNTIVHTRTAVKLEVCTYDATTQKAAIEANGSFLLPDALEELLICGTISYLFREDETPGTVQQYVKYFQDGLSQLDKGVN